MRKIDLIHYSTPNMLSVYIKHRKYCVYLGNGSTTYYSDEKKAKRFLEATNIMLNETLDELNYLLAIAFTEYRKIWFIMDNKDYHKVETEMLTLFANCDKQILTVTTKCHTINANAFIFKYMIDICRDEIILFEKITGILKDKNYFSEYRRVAVFLRQAQGARTTIDTWGI